MPVNAIIKLLRSTVHLFTFQRIWQSLTKYYRTVTMILLQISLVLIFSSAVVHGTQVADSANFVFGDCKAGRDSCKECYQTLVKCLLGSDENVVNLSRAFYPPQTNPAEFIAVTYQYANETTDELDGTETWFWAASGAYFLHPLHVFTYISLLFDKPEPYFTQTAHVTLRASCRGAQREHMILLTHRVRLYCEFSVQYVYSQMIQK